MGVGSPQEIEATLSKLRTVIPTSIDAVLPDGSWNKDRLSGIPHYHMIYRCKTQDELKLIRFVESSGREKYHWDDLEKEHVLDITYEEGQ